jgi:hypothetical protein
MEKGKDCDQNFSLTLGIAIARYFINPPPGSPDANNTLGFEESVWKRAETVGNILKTYMCQLTWMTALLHVNQRTLWPLSRRKYSHAS